MSELYNYIWSLPIAGSYKMVSIFKS